MAAYLSPGSNAIWYPYCFFVPKKSIYMVGRIFLHYIPSYFFDLLAIINGRKERYFHQKDFAGSILKKILADSQKSIKKSTRPVRL